MPSSSPLTSFSLALPSLSPTTQVERDVRRAKKLEAHLQVATNGYEARAAQHAKDLPAMHLAAHEAEAKLRKSYGCCVVVLMLSLFAYLFKIFKLSFFSFHAFTALTTAKLPLP